MSAPASIPARLSLDLPQQELTAITDAAIRALTAIDINDKMLWESAFVDADDTTFSMNGEILTGMEAINKRIFGTVSELDTAHHISNVRITHISDDKKSAKFMAYAWAQHFRAGEGLLVDKEGRTNVEGSVHYYIDVVKDEDDGLWKVKKWTMNFIWLKGDTSILAPKG